MTIVESMDALAAVAPGTPVSVGQGRSAVQWLRSENGLTYGGIEVPIETLAGNVAQRTVTLAVQMTRGATFENRGSGWTFVLIAPTVEQDGQGTGWWAVRLATGDGSYSMMTALESIPDGSRQVNEGTWRRTVLMMGEALLAQRRELGTVRTTLRDLTRQVQTATREVEQRTNTALTDLRARASDALAPVVGALTENDTATRDLLVTAMTNLGIATPRAEIHVRITVGGWQSSPNSDERLADLLPEGVALRSSASVTPLYIPWEAVVETTVEGPQGSCVCSHAFTNSQVIRLVRDQHPDLGVYSIERWTARCGNHPEDQAATEKPKRDAERVQGGEGEVAS